MGEKKTGSAYGLHGHLREIKEFWPEQPGEWCFTCWNEVNGELEGLYKNMIVVVELKISSGHIKMDMPIRCPKWKYKAGSWKEKSEFHGRGCESNINVGIISMLMTLEAIRLNEII